MSAARVACEPCPKATEPAAEETVELDAPIATLSAPAVLALVPIEILFLAEDTALAPIAVEPIPALRELEPMEIAFSCSARPEPNVTA